jgi:hypothetical protein
VAYSRNKYILRDSYSVLLHTFIPSYAVLCISPTVHKYSITAASVSVNLLTDLSFHPLLPFSVDREERNENEGVSRNEIFRPGRSLMGTGKNQTLLLLLSLILRVM